MSPHAISVNLDQTLAEAAEVFSQHHITWAPVVDKNGACVGVFSVADLLKPRENATTVTFNSHERVREYATLRIFTTTTDALLLAAAATMSNNHIHRLPVLGPSGRLQGVLSTMDVVAALLNSVQEMDVELLTHLKREKNASGV